MITSLRAYLALSLLCLALYVPGLTTLPPLDRDEARFAQATAQMLETGEFIDIRFQNQPRHKKPAGVYWLQAISVATLSDVETREIWAYRVPSVVGAWLAVLLTFAAGRRLFDDRVALLGAALLAGSMLLVVEAHQAKTDAVLLATVVAAQAALARFYAAARHNDDAVPAVWAWVFWTAQGIGLLVKGPITPMVSALTVAAVVAADRDWRWLRGLKPWPGAALALIIPLPWFIAMMVISDGAFLQSSVGTDLLAKVAAGQESHGAPPGVYTVLMLAFFWPASLFAWPALIRAFGQWRVPGIRFCLAWLIPAWFVFEAIPTKLPHYVLPLYPALALLTAEAVFAAASGAWKGLTRWPARALAVLWAVLGGAVAVGGIAAPIVLGDGPTWWSVVSAAVVGGLVLVLREVWRDRPMRAAVAGVAVGGAMLAVALHAIMPRLDAMWVSREVADAVARHAPDRVHPVAAAGFHEPSLVFLLGTETVLTGGSGVPGYLLANPGAIGIVDDREDAGFQRALDDPEGRIEIVETIDGINYSKGRRVQIVVYRSTP